MAPLLQAGHIGDIRERQQQAQQVGRDAVNIVVAEHEGIEIGVHEDPRGGDQHAQGDIDDAEEAPPADLQEQADDQHDRGDRQDDQADGEGGAVFFDNHPVEVGPGAHRHFKHAAGIGILSLMVAEGNGLPGILRLQGGEEVYGFQQSAGQGDRGRAEAVDLLPVHEDFRIVEGQEADIVHVAHPVRERAGDFEYAVFVICVALVGDDGDFVSVRVLYLEVFQVDDVAGPGFELRVQGAVDGRADGGENQEHEETQPENIEYLPVVLLNLHGGCPPPAAGRAGGVSVTGFCLAAVIRRAGHPGRIRPGCPRCGRSCRRWRRSHRHR